MISFIIITLNEEKYIGKTLDYISQYAGPHEIILSDANSSDKTVEIARKYTDKIIVHSTEGKRLRLAASRNIGASRASGEYLVFLDAEICVVEPNPFFKKAIQCFKEDKNLVGLTCQLHVFKEMETLADKIIIQGFIYIFMIMNNYLHIGAATGELQMIPRRAYDMVHGFDERLTVSDDQDMFRRLSKIGRTHLEMSLIAYHVGRRAHAVGWPRLIYLWTANTLSMTFFKRDTKLKYH